MYRASEHGFTAAAFHDRCDKKGSNIAIIKSEHGMIFGGYTSLNWDSTDLYGVDNNLPFIFSLDKNTMH